MNTLQAGNFSKRVYEVYCYKKYDKLKPSYNQFNGWTTSVVIFCKKYPVWMSVSTVSLILHFSYTSEKLSNEKYIQNKKGRKCSFNRNLQS